MEKISYSPYPPFLNKELEKLPYAVDIASVHVDSQADDETPDHRWQTLNLNFFLYGNLRTALEGFG